MILRLPGHGRGRRVRHKRNFAVRPNWILTKTTIHSILVCSRCRAMILPLRLILSLETAGKKTEADQERETATETFGPNGLPAIHLDAKNETVARLSRIKTELDVTALRGEIEPAAPPASEASSTSSSDTSVMHLRRGRQELSAGHADAAEKEFRAVLAVDPGSPAAHRGLAEIDRRQGKMDDAVKELQEIG